MSVWNRDACSLSVSQSIYPFVKVWETELVVQVWAEDTDIYKCTRNRKGVLQDCVFVAFFLHLFWFFWKAAPFRGLNIWYILMLVLNFTSLFCKEPIIPWIITIIKYIVLNNCIISAQISFLTECILFNTKINNMFSSMKVSIYCFIKKTRKNSKALAFIFNFIRVSGWLSCLSNWAVCWLKFGNKTWIQFIYGFKQLFDKLLKYLCFLFFIGVV